MCVKSWECILKNILQKLQRRNLAEKKHNFAKKISENFK
jgi:hypothetical protein